MQLADFFFAPPERKKKETFMQADVRKRNEKTKNLKIHSSKISQTHNINNIYLITITMV